MSRIDFLEPQGELDASLALDAYLLIDGPYAEVYVAKLLEFFKMLTRTELLLIYDWSMREHLYASDNKTVRRREKPGLFKLIEKTWESVTNMERVIGEHDSQHARVEELEEEVDVLQTRIAALESQLEIAGAESGGEPSVH